MYQMVVYDGSADGSFHCLPSNILDWWTVQVDGSLEVSRY
jgi:hypothetical protein